MLFNPRVMLLDKFPDQEASSLAIIALLVSSLGRFPPHSLFLSLLRLGGLVLLGLLCMLPIHVAEVPAGFDDIPHPPLELLGLWEAPILPPVPEHLCRGGLGLCALAVRYRDDERAPRGRLEGDLAEGGGKGGQEFLGVL